MKKIFALALSLVLVLAMFTLTGCGSPLDGDDAAAALSYIQEETNKLSSFKAEMTVTTGVSGQTETQTTTMYWTKDGDGASSKMVTEGTEVITVGTTAYTKISMGDEEMKIKSTVDAEEASPIGDFLDGAGDAEFVSRENGVYKIKVNLTEETLNDLLGDLSELGGTASTADLSMVITCGSDGIIDSLDITANVELSMTGVTMTMTITVTMTISDVNSVDKITAPADADEYVDASAE